MTLRGPFYRPFDAGLGAVSSPRLDAAWGSYTRLKDDTHALLARFPGANDPTDFMSLVRRVSELPRGDSRTLVRLSGSQLAMLLKGALSVVVQNLGTAYTIAGGPQSGVRGREMLRLVETAERVMQGARAIVDSVNVVMGTADSAQRAVGLGATARLGELTAGAIVLLLVAGAVAIVEVVLVFALVAYIASAVEAHIAATTACAHDAAAGRPCSGAEYEAYRAAALEQARSFGIVPNIRGAVGQAADAVEDVIFYGGMLAVAVGIGYLLYVGAPAAREARSWAHEEAASARSRRAASRTRAGYR